MHKLEFILKFGHFAKDPLGNIGCSDEYILGHFNRHMTVGQSKEEAAKKMVEVYDQIIKNDQDLNRRALWDLGWSINNEALEIRPERIKDVYLSIISNSDWIYSQTMLAPIGREYLLKECLPANFWIEFYKKHFIDKIPQDYSELFSDIRSLDSDLSFEFNSYNKKDCIREGFFQVYKNKTLEELKQTLKTIKGF